MTLVGTLTLQISPAVALLTNIVEVFGLNLEGDTPPIHAKNCTRFPQPFHTYSGVATRIGHDRFLSNPFQFIIHHQ
jgi:hypothetical protein